MIFSPHEHFDNAAAANKHIDVRPLAAAMGAEIAASISRERQRRRLCRDRSGAVPPQDDLFSRPAADDPRRSVGVQPPLRRLCRGRLHQRRARLSRGAAADQGGRTSAPACCSARAGIPIRPSSPSRPRSACSVPSRSHPIGGDTIWANSALAYRCSSDTMQGLLQRLKVHMSMGNVLESARAYAAPDDNAVGQARADQGHGNASRRYARKVQGISTRSCAPTRAPANRRSIATRPMPPGIEG